jgi:hypothetical protein
VRAGVIASRAIAREERAEDLVGICLFLASEASSFITGQIVVVDGGATFHSTRAMHALRGLRALPMMQGETALVPMDDEDHDSICEPHYRLVVRPDQVLPVFL